MYSQKAKSRVSFSTFPYNKIISLPYNGNLINVQLDNFLTFICGSEFVHWKDLQGCNCLPYISRLYKAASFHTSLHYSEISVVTAKGI